MLDRIREARRNESGFTLIELLIVIVILGVLAGIVVFAVSAFNNDGKQASCKSDFKNTEIADEAFYAKSTAATKVYATAWTSLVPTYIKEAPGTVTGAAAANTNGYTITLTSAGPTVTVGSTTSTDNSACGSL